MVATAKKSSWFMAEFMTLRRIVSPGSTGNLTVSTLSKPQQM
jgi:hypothetical protein